MDPNIPTQPIQPVQSEISAQQPLPSKKSNKKIVFWVFAILLFLIAFVVGGFFTGAKQNKSASRSQQKNVTPAPDPTADWKTYTNAEVGLQIKYPPEFGVYIKKTPFSFEIAPDDFDLNVSSSEGIYIAKSSDIAFAESKKDEFAIVNASVRIFKGGGTWTSLEAYEESQKQLSDIDVKLSGGKPSGYTFKNSIINGQPALEIVYKDTDETYLIKGNTVFGLAVYPNSSGDTMILKRIISTFKFIKGASYWKTYANKTYNYSIKYPNNYIVSSPESDRNSDNSTWSDVSICINADCFIGVYAEKNVPSLLIDDWLKTRTDLYYPQTDKKENTKFNGYDVVKITHRDESGQIQKVYYYYFNYGLNRYQISGNSDNPLDNQILSTFKFTN